MEICVGSIGVITLTGEGRSSLRKTSFSLTFYVIWTQHLTASLN